ncbi:MAG: hypothetical protein LBR00_04600 [Clostridiales Family XIII bacterium]|jgi:magnesium transporter|nr:hypothetical protein [Clostridiales Family XIII bacterium]
MKVFDLENKRTWDAEALPDGAADSAALFVLCRPKDVPTLADVFGWSRRSVDECCGKAERNHHILFEGYDFVSFAHVDMEDAEVGTHFFQVYVSARYVVLVLDTDRKPCLRRIEEKMLEAAAAQKSADGALNRLYAFILYELFLDYYDLLESVEDRLETMSESIVSGKGPLDDLFPKIDMLRRVAYQSKKQVRAVNYLCDQIQLDDNELIAKTEMRHFRSVFAGFRKLNDFAGSIYVMSGEILNNFDSRVSAKTNETVNKLTVITFFFAPLTFIAGIYGMNFARMPELAWNYGYLYVLLLLVGISVFMFWLMKRNKWL